MISSQALGFVLVGVIAGLANVLLRIAFNLVVPYEVAIALAFLVALTVAFALNRSRIFRATEGRVVSQYVRFAIVNLLALLQVWTLSMVLANLVFPQIGMTWHPETVAHTIGVLSPVVSSFFAYKYYVFAKSLTDGAIKPSELGTSHLAARDQQGLRLPSDSA